MTSATVFGVDVGGSGIKGAAVDLEAGEFAAERVRIDTPHPATPAAVCDVIGAVLTEAGAPEDVTLGITLPAVLTHGIARTAANIDSSWIGTDVVAAVRERTGRALLFDGTLLANTELGHLELDGHVAEKRASDAARTSDDLGYEHWGRQASRLAAQVN